MSLVEQVKRVVNEGTTENSNNDSLQRLRDFLAEKQKEGAVLKQKYDLPLIDTVGRATSRRR